MEDGFPKLPGGIYAQNIIGMTLIGLMMVGLTHAFGHSYVDGVGYGVIQSILDKDMTATNLLVLLFGLKLLATTISLGCGASGGIFSPSLYLGATLGAAFASLAALVLPNAGLTLPSAAIVGMAAMVGAGTGGVMTAIIMVFEMTRDYAIIVPVIVAVAVAAGVRRALIPETIYTVKLRHRGHRIPKERHVNLYLVQQTQDIMERRFILAKAGSSLRECMGWEDVDDLRAIIVEHEGRIVGLIPPRSGLWRESVNNPDRLVDDFVEKRAVVCRDVDLLSLVLARLKRHRAGAAIVFKGDASASRRRCRRRHHQARHRRRGHRQLRRLGRFARGQDDPFGFSWAAAISLRKAPILGVGFPWISLDSLVRIETYQWVTRIKRRKNFPIASPSCGERPERERVVKDMRRRRIVTEQS